MLMKTISVESQQDCLEIEFVLSWEDREKAEANVMEYIHELKKLVSRNSDVVESTRRQFWRYSSWWEKPLHPDSEDRLDTRGLAESVVAHHGETLLMATSKRSVVLSFDWDMDGMTLQSNDFDRTYV